MDLKSCIAYLLKDKRGMNESAVGEILKIILGINQKELKNAIKEMRQKKELHFKEDLIKPTARIKRRIPRVEKINYSLPLWHRRWTMVVFNIPEEGKRIRDQIRYQLKKYGFSIWQNSLWISPHALPKELAQYFFNHGLSERVKVFYGNLPSKDEEELVASVWQIKRLEKQYQNFIQEAKRRFKRLKRLENLNSDLKEKALDLLAKITEIKYLEIFKQDPKLPRPLLPRDWVGLRAFRIYQQLEKYLK